MRSIRSRKLRLILIACLPFIFSGNALADAGNLGQVQGFIKSVITAIAGVAGLIATGFFVVGGFRYITSSGNPLHLEKAKKTLMYSAGGLAIIIGAFVLSNIVTGLANSAFGG